MCILNIYNFFVDVHSQIFFKKNVHTSIYIYIYCMDNFCFKGQGLDHVGTLGNFVVPHWKKSLPLSTL